MEFCGEDKVYRDRPEVVNPYSQTGERARQGVLGAGYQQLPKAMQAADLFGAAATRGAQDQGWGQARRLASETLGGKYLGTNPYLEQSLSSTRRAAMGSAADQNARLSDQYARAGLGFSTANQQAQQANQAAIASQLAAQENQARLANYMQERQNQQNAVQLLQQATTTPAQLLSAVPGTMMQPISQAAAIAQGLGQDQVVVPNSAVVRQPGVFDYGIAAMGAIPSA